ncbi:MAG: glucosamine-6-phosphate deaminase [Cyclobacteriaceae bacterium]|nr:glucosamine-6-phosphate deaminase [Cyclobacteriaceae bacterium]
MQNTDFRQMNVDLLRVKIYPDDTSMGHAAADYVEQILVSLIDRKGSASIILATGASQFSFYQALNTKESITWSKVTVFHLDEYAGMTSKHPASFRKYLKERILDHVRPANVYFLQGDAENTEEEVARYEALLKRSAIDLACIGIGENGHIAFNDPPVADFKDSKLVKVVKLDEGCRLQQLGEGWFPTLNDVPTHALSLTVPGIMRADKISCVVPDERKAKAIHQTLYGPISEKCPASILRRHSDCTLFLDELSALGLRG